MQLDDLQHEIEELAELAVGAGLKGDDEYEENADAIVSGWLARNKFEVTEDNVYEVRNDFDYYTNRYMTEQ
jgi:hypothetical protein